MIVQGAGDGPLRSGDFLSLLSRKGTKSESASILCIVSTKNGGQKAHCLQIVEHDSCLP